MGLSWASPGLSWASPGPLLGSSCASAGLFWAALDFSWLLFLAVLVHQMGRVMIQAVETSVIADKDYAPQFEESVGAMLSGVSLVCLAGKLLAAAVTDKLGGWLVLIVVFVCWVFATVGTVLSPTVDLFGYAWLLDSFAYTITWGAVLQAGEI